MIELLKSQIHTMMLIKKKNITTFQTEHKEEIVKRNDAIRGLRKELEDANELVKVMKHQGGK